MADFIIPLSFFPFHTLPFLTWVAHKRTGQLVLYISLQKIQGIATSAPCISYRSNDFSIFCFCPIKPFCFSYRLFRSLQSFFIHSNYAGTPSCNRPMVSLCSMILSVKRLICFRCPSYFGGQPLALFRKLYSTHLIAKFLTTSFRICCLSIAQIALDNSQLAIRNKRKPKPRSFLRLYLRPFNQL